jgi:hypothetical protein
LSARSQCPWSRVKEAGETVRPEPGTSSKTGIACISGTLTFASAFGGNKVVYLAAANNSGWQPSGVWQVPWNPTGTIVVSGMTPVRGSTAAGTQQSYTFTFTDTKGSGDIGIIDVLINSGIDARNACCLAYIASLNTVVLVNAAGDAGGPFAGAIAPGWPVSIVNNQCAISGAGGSAISTGDTLSLTLNLTFKTGFAGSRIVYLAGRDSNGLNNTDWQPLGTLLIQ